MLRIHEQCGHKLLNFLLLKIVKNVSTCRPRLGYPSTGEIMPVPLQNTRK